MLSPSETGLFYVCLCFFISLMHCVLFMSVCLSPTVSVSLWVCLTWNKRIDWLIQFDLCTTVCCFNLCSAAALSPQFSLDQLLSAVAAWGFLPPEVFCQKPNFRIPLQMPPPAQYRPARGACPPSPTPFPPPLAVGFLLCFGLLPTCFVRVSAIRILLWHRQLGVSQSGKTAQSTVLREWCCDYCRLLP